MGNRTTTNTGTADTAVGTAETTLISVQAKGIRQGEKVLLTGWAEITSGKSVV